MSYYIMTVHGHSVTTYHTEKDCHVLQQAPKSIDKAEVERRGLDLCQHCDGGVGGQTEQNWDYQKLLRDDWSDPEEAE